jgi:hypothetical protein
MPFVAADHEISCGCAIAGALHAKRAPTHIAETQADNSWIMVVMTTGNRGGKPFQE